MRILALAFILPCVLSVIVWAGGDKQLQNVKGSVSYQRGGQAAQGLAATATVVLSDRDYAITGNQSLGVVTLPDSSRVTMGSRTRVQLAFFNQAEGTTAKFIVFGGKTRFNIEHPGGKPANYVFQTPTAQIAVRGTEGDIGVNGRNLTVNVYGLTDPNLPVIVTTQDGKHFVLRAGQQLLANWVRGQIQTQVNALTEHAVTHFQELGAPVSNWASAVQALPQTATSAITSHVPFSSSLGGIHLGPRPATSPGSPTPTPGPCSSQTPQSGISGFFKRIVAPKPTPCISPSPSPTP